MTSNHESKKLTLRRLATFIAAIGVLVMSSGVALMVSAGPANAAVTQVGVCHAQSSDSNPYTFIVVDNDSTQLQAHLAHQAEPNKTWKNAGTYEGVLHAAGDPKPDFVGVDITSEDCDGDVEVPPTEATADVDFIDPSCANENLADFEAIGSNVTFEITDGSKAPGAEIEVTATANEGSEFEDESTKQVFTHTFGPALNLDGPPCKIVEGPVVATASVDFVDPTCANGNTASYQGSGDNVSFAITSGSEAAGADIKVTATADEGKTFADESTTKDFTHTFGAAEDPCGDVAGPTETPVATPTVVHSGLVTPDMRGEQGLALLVTGMVLLVLAGGLSLVRPTGQARS